MISQKEIVTINNYPGKEVTEVLGYVKGSVVQSKHVGRDFMAGLKTIVGGELKGYTEMLEEARQIATERMLQEADALGADAVIGFKIQTSAVTQGASEIIAYGTAVKFK
ncbi:MAG: YbjQ family protein [Acholeplasmataceae bacterium]